MAGLLRKKAVSIISKQTSFLSFCKNVKAEKGKIFKHATSAPNTKFGGGFFDTRCENGKYMHIKNQPLLKSNLEANINLPKETDSGGGRVYVNLNAFQSDNRNSFLPFKMKTARTLQNVFRLKKSNGLERSY